MKKNFEFELYRVNVIRGERLLFGPEEKAIKNNGDVVKIIKAVTQPEVKTKAKGTKNSFEWVLRDFCQYKADAVVGEVYGISLAKALMGTASEIITDTGLKEGFSVAEPAAAKSSRLFFFMQRHLMIIERCSEITGSERWKTVLEGMLKDVAEEQGFTDWLEFEPIPRKEEIFEAFRSFDRLTRLRLLLRLPNPELSRFAKQLYEDMENGGIREYLQDMKNPRGLNTKEGNLPHAATEIAAGGYKKGEVLLEGVRGEKKDKIRTGRDAARGSIKELKDYVRGIKDNAKSKEAQKITAAIMAEIERIHPTPKERKNE